MSTPPVVHNYYVQDDLSVPVPIFITPNVSMDSLVLSQSKSVPFVREKRGREQTQNETRIDGITVRTSAINASNGGNTSERMKKVVNPYEKRHQGPVKPIFSEKEEDMTYTDWYAENYRRTKLPRKEPIVLTEESYNNNNNNNGSSVERNLSSLRADIKRMQDQYDNLSRLVDEARVELQRSREAGEHTKETALSSVADLRVDIAQVRKHIELLDERHTSLEKTVVSLKGLETLVDSFRSDIALLRGEVSQKFTAIAVLENMISDVKRQSSTTLGGAGFPAFNFPTTTNTHHQHQNNNNSGGGGGGGNDKNENYSGNGGNNNNNNNVLITGATTTTTTTTAAADFGKQNTKDIFLNSTGSTNVAPATNNIGFAAITKTAESHADNALSLPKNPFAFGGTSNNLTAGTPFGFNTAMKTTEESTTTTTNTASGNSNNNFTGGGSSNMFHPAPVASAATTTTINSGNNNNNNNNGDNNTNSNKNNTSSFTSVSCPTAAPAFSFGGVVSSAPPQPPLKAADAFSIPSFGSPNVFAAAPQSNVFGGASHLANTTTTPAAAAATGALTFAQPTSLEEQFMSAKDKANILGKPPRRRTSNRY